MSCFVLLIPFSTDDLLLLQISSGVVWQIRDLYLSHNTLYLLSPRFCFFIVLKHDLFVNSDDLLTNWRVFMQTEQPTKCFVPLQKLRARSAPLNMFKTPSNSSCTDRSRVVILLWFSVACFWC